MKILILALLALRFVYNMILHTVSARSANNPIPENVSDIYDAETYKKWRAYSAEHAHLSLIFSILSFVVDALLLLTNAYASFAFLLGGEFYFSAILLLAIVELILDIPRSYIANMIIEEKYGFNRTKTKTFVADCIRSFLLNFALSYLLVSIIASCHMWFGDYMAIFCAIALVTFSLLLNFISPVFLKIGNKFTPLEEGELRDRLQQLLTSHGYKVRAIEVMDASRRTTKQNAYFTGFGKTKKIVLYDNLVNGMTPDEICAVFAHELGHGLHKDTLKLLLLNSLNFVMIALLAWFAVSTEALYTAFGFGDVNYGFAYIVLGILLGLLQPFTGMITNACSRRFEYAADRQAVKEGYGEAMIPALKKLAKENFSHLAPSPVYVVLEYSHPPIDKRIAAIEKELTANSQPIC